MRASTWRTRATSSASELSGSCGAVTSGLDLALHLLDCTYGPKVALAVEALLEDVSGPGDMGLERDDGDRPPTEFGGETP